MDPVKPLDRRERGWGEGVFKLIYFLNKVFIVYLVCYCIDYGYKSPLPGPLPEGEGNKAESKMSSKLT